MLTSQNWHRFAALSAFVCALALAGCGKQADPPKGENDPQPIPPGSTPPVGPSKEEPAVYPAAAFREAMGKDRNFPVSKHADKAVVVTGEVRGYGHGRSLGAVILDAGPDKALDTIACKVTGKQPWLKVLPNQTVTLRVVVPKSVADPDHLEWQIVEAKGPSPDTLTAGAFVKAWRADGKAFDKKYFMKPVIVTGTVAEVKAGDGGGKDVLLSAGDKEKLICAFYEPDLASAQLTPSQQSALKPGLKVKFLGHFTGGKVGDCIMLEPAP